MDYEKRYNDALERARQFSEHPLQEDSADIVEYIFPELKESESEDEKMKKAIKHVLYENYTDAAVIEGVEIAEIVAWLEKQGEKTHAELGQLAVTKTSDQELEPKFKVGDWVISNDGTHTYLVKERKRGIYVILDIGEDKEFCIDIETADRTGRLWTIQDAKDGDVLTASDDSIFLFAGVVDCACKYYAALITTDNYVEINKGGCGCWEISRAAYPATKEQRELLFRNIKEAGYQWDSERKELKKMEVTSKEIDDAYLQGICDAKHEIEKQGEKTHAELGQLAVTKTSDQELEPKKLDAAEVIEWLNNQACQGWIIDFEIDKFVEKFKKDFGL